MYPLAIVWLEFLEGIKLDVNVLSAILTWKSQFLKWQFLMYFLEVISDMYLFLNNLEYKKDKINITVGPDNSVSEG